MLYMPKEEVGGRTGVVLGGAANSMYTWVAVSLAGHCPKLANPQHGNDRIERHGNLLSTIRCLVLRCKKSRESR